VQIVTFKCNDEMLWKYSCSNIELTASATEVIRSLSHDDLVIVCSGTNDYNLNGFSLTFRNIKHYIMTHNHTNILLLKVPFRYDLPNTLSINENISILNRRLHKLTKAFPHSNFLTASDNRNLFTTHGLHRSKLGKRLVNLQLAHFLLTIFDQKTSLPISIGWWDKCNDSNLPCEAEQVKTLPINLNRNRKPPVTRSDDFLRLT
jgi:hypothetical protein